MAGEPNRLARELIKYAIVSVILAGVGWGVYWLVTRPPNVDDNAAPREVPVNVVVREVTAGPLPDRDCTPSRESTGPERNGVRCIA